MKFIKSYKIFENNIEVLVIDIIEELNELFGIPVCYYSDQFKSRGSNRSIVFALVDKVYYDSNEYYNRNKKISSNIEEIKARYNTFYEYLIPRIEYLKSGDIKNVDVLYYMEKSFAGSSNKLFSWEELENYLNSEYKEKIKVDGDIEMKDIRTIVVTLI